MVQALNDNRGATSVSNGHRNLFGSAILQKIPDFLHFICYRIYSVKPSTEQLYEFLVVLSALLLSLYLTTRYPVEGSEKHEYVYGPDALSTLLETPRFLDVKIRSIIGFISHLLWIISYPLRKLGMLLSFPFRMKITLSIFRSVSNFFRYITQGVLNLLIGLKNRVFRVISGFNSILSIPFGWVGGFFRKIFGSVLNSLRLALCSVARFVSNLFSFINRCFGSTFSGIARFFKGLFGFSFEGFKSAIMMPIYYLLRPIFLLKNIMLYMFNGIKMMFAAALQFRFRDLFSLTKIRTLFRSLLNWFANIFLAVRRSIVRMGSGVRILLSRVAFALVRPIILVYRLVRYFFTNTRAVLSSLRRLPKLGLYFVKNLFLWLKRFLSTALYSLIRPLILLLNLIKNIRARFRLATLLSDIKLFIGSLRFDIRSGITGLIKKVSGLFGGFGRLLGRLVFHLTRPVRFVVNLNIWRLFDSISLPFRKLIWTLLRPINLLLKFRPSMIRIGLPLNKLKLIIQSPLMGLKSICSLIWRLLQGIALRFKLFTEILMRKLIYIVSLPRVVFNACLLTIREMRLKRLFRALFGPIIVLLNIIRWFIGMFSFDALVKIKDFLDHICDPEIPRKC